MELDSVFESEVLNLRFCIFLTFHTWLALLVWCGLCGAINANKKLAIAVVPVGF